MRSLRADRAFVTTLLQSVADYYAGKLARHGTSPRGVDWNGADGQKLRFDLLLRVAEPPIGGFALDDYGCGYGALLDYLRLKRRKVDYLGLDVSERMIDAARQHHPGDAARFVTGMRSPRHADYAVASGIFNVRLAASISKWERLVCSTLEMMNERSERGFAFNCLTRYADKEHMKKYLYYGDPCFYFDLCQRQFSRNVALFHDYGLYEFTIVVRKEFEA